MALARRLLHSSSSLARIDFTSRRHFIQLAGGTNDHSSQAVEENGLQTLTGFGGYAFGGYARKSILQHWETHPAADKLVFGIDFAEKLVATVKKSR